VSHDRPSSRHRRRGLAAGALAVVPVVQGLAAGPHAVAKGPLYAKLLGANEIPTKGDPDGRGSATLLVPSSTKVCFAILVSGIAKPNAAHIHRGGPSVAGPIAVGLTPPKNGNPGTVGGCVSASASVVSDIVARPATYYVNVHNAAYPGGAMRGQLFAR
jgi:hypothetical protein